ncbi:class I SAM-dependent methyltransferase [bacterium]|nr:class I SAM-dependent methyltransferase [bacterium]
MEISNTNRMSYRCWLCGSDQLTLIKRSNINGALDSRTFSITDSKYGITGSIYQCTCCGFRQCSELDDVLRYYEDLEDESYEEGRVERSIQAKKLIEIIARYKARGRLLDIGAGTGNLVEVALNMGFDAQGLEPSKWLQGLAQKRGLPVYLGTFPHSALVGPYDIVTLIDVIEHVHNPVALLRGARDIVAEDGVIVVVTPNVASCMARMLGWWWWHYRVAHIGYFHRETLAFAAEKAHLQLVKMKRPTWFFSADYLFERVMTYFPAFMRMKAPVLLKKILIPLNLGDSLMGIYVPQKG